VGIPTAQHFPSGFWLDDERLDGVGVIAVTAAPVSDYHTCKGHRLFLKSA
jgi:hypothetical protein